MIESPINGPGEEEVLYYKTPCKHVFHSNCLENWMKIKHECPTCRGGLPK